MSKIKGKNAFTAPQLGFHKVESLKENLVYFLQQIRIILNEFGLETSEINFEKNCFLRKSDNQISVKGYFFLFSRPENIFRLFNRIPFIYSNYKKIRFNKIIDKFLKNNSNLDFKIYDVAIKLHESGLGHVKIFKQLNLPNNYLYKLNYWIYYNKKPKYYNVREEIKKMKKETFILTCIC
jgi:hypothetical protein